MTFRGVVALVLAVCFVGALAVLGVPGVVERGDSAAWFKLAVYGLNLAAWSAIAVQDLRRGKPDERPATTEA